MPDWDDLRGSLISGVFFHASSPGRIEFLHQPLISLDDRGRIASVVSVDDLGYQMLLPVARVDGKLIICPNDMVLGIGAGRLGRRFPKVTSRSISRVEPRAPHGT